MRVIAKGYYGMGGNISVLVTAMILAEKLGAELSVDWLSGVYGVDGKDIYQHLFQVPLNDLSFKNIDNCKVWPEYWQNWYKETMPYKVIDGNDLARVSTDTVIENNIEHIKDNYDVVVISRDSSWWHKGEFREECKRALDLLIPSNAIQEYIKQYDLGKNAIAVHFRHGNGEATVVPPDINWFFDQVDLFLKKSPLSKVFLCTDCQRVLDIFEERYGDIVLSTNKLYPPLGFGAMHANTDHNDRVRSAEEAVIDIWLMGKCKYFVGSKSFFSTTAMKLANATSSDIKVWAPLHRSHRKEPDKEPVASWQEVSEKFEAMNLPMDGIFYSVDNGGYSFYYLYDFLYRSENLYEIDFDGLKSKILRKRLY